MTVLLYSEIWKNKFVLYTISEQLSRMAGNSMTFADFYDEVKREIFNAVITAGSDYACLSMQDIQNDILSNTASGYHAEPVTSGRVIYVADGTRTDRKIHIIGASINDADSSFMNLSRGRRIGGGLIDTINEFPSISLEAPNNTEENKEEFKLTILGDE